MQGLFIRYLCRSCWILSLLLLTTSISCSSSPTALNKTSKIAPASLPSPYIWGTNLVTLDNKDYFLTDQHTQQLMQQIHVRLVRFPDRHDAKLYQAAARMVKKLGFVPLAILPYDNIELDRQLVIDMNTIFGQEQVYYEFGNERDGNWQGPAQSSTDYTRAWNKIIPTLKKLVHNAKFIGPVNYHANPSYIADFVAHATVQPDAVSWHEYSCKSGDSDATCLNNLETWTQHIHDTNKAVKQAIGKTLPIIISEWNWNPLNTPDPRIHNYKFIYQWTQKAFKILITNHIFAANQYCISNSSLAMIDDSTHRLSGQAQAFQDTYVQYLGKQNNP